MGLLSAVLKKAAPVAAGATAATQSEDTEAGFAGMLAKGANKDGALAALGKYYDDFKDPKSAKNPHDIGDAHESLMEQYLMSKAAGNSRQGWFVGADGKPRFEFNDATASVDKGFNRKIQGLIRDKIHAGEEMRSQLGLILKHDNLFNLYPDTKEIPLFFETDEFMGGSLGGYVPIDEVPERVLKAYPETRAGLMAVNADQMLETDRDELISTLLHEAQHAIQDREGLSGGASMDWSPDTFLSRHIDYTGEAGFKADMLNDLINHAEKHGNEQGLSRFLYGLNAGEAESRAVELRRLMKARERADLPAWLYYTDNYDAPIGSRSLFDFIESK